MTKAVEDMSTHIHHMRDNQPLPTHNHELKHEVVIKVNHHRQMIVQAVLTHSHKMDYLATIKKVRELQEL